MVVFNKNNNKGNNKGYIKVIKALRSFSIRIIIRVTIKVK